MEDSSHEIEDEEQLWRELQSIASQHCSTSELIDDCLRNFLELATAHRGTFLTTEYDIANCSFTLLCGALFEQHEEYVRTQIIHSLLQDDDVSVQAFVASFLLLDVRETETTAESLNEVGAFPRLVDLIANPASDEDVILHRLLMELLYEMSRIQCIRRDDLLHVNDSFIYGLFELIEELSVDASDPYHYHVIRVILVLNEQFMVSAHGPAAEVGSSVTLTNKVMKILSSQGNRYKVFGENIILLLNRESESSLQLLTLKLLYLIFTTPSTQEYFYTNDLRVLVDILIRNLLDLPSEATSLRHTYLRVFYPLLAHTQLNSPPYYKAEEVRKLLGVLSGDHFVQETLEDSVEALSVSGHFEELDDTTKRLVARCRTVTWLQVPQRKDTADTIESDPGTPSSPVDSVSGEKIPPAPPISRKLRKRSTATPSPTFLRPNLDAARESAMSMVEIAGQREKPGVLAPSKRASLLGGSGLKEKLRPPPPQTRRSAWSRLSKAAATPAAEHGPIENELTTEPESETLSSQIISKEVSERPLSPKKAPPPAPKTRRLRGKRRVHEDEGGGAPSHLQSMEQQRCLVGPVSANEQSGQNISVKQALSTVQDEAAESINKAMDSVNLSPINHPHRTAILTPPSPAPRRGVPAPTLSLEGSPFLDDGD